MRETQLALNEWAPGDWPDVIHVSHVFHGSALRERGRRYVPERTCRIEDADDCPIEDVRCDVHTYRCSACGGEYESLLPHGYGFCPRCGARVVRGDE